MIQTSYLRVMQKKKILVCVMNWGLGHATRCIPVIDAVQKDGFQPVLASDGEALRLLQKEFPQLESFELPSYNIRYSRNPKMLKWKLIFDTPHILRTIKKEHRVVQRLLKQENISGIISDNRFGTYSGEVKTAFITHQLKVLSGKTTFLTSKIHQKYIRKFDECWVPDSTGTKNLSGIMGHAKGDFGVVKYLGPLSRLEKKKMSQKYDFLVLLSGPEPQRTVLENILLKAFKETTKDILFVRGAMSEEIFTYDNSRVCVRNYIFGQELEEAINSSGVVISRSGYTTVMDLAKLRKRAFFIPTPGQPEQEYLAERLMKFGMAPYCKQKDFKPELLENQENYSGLRDFGCTSLPGDLFGLFKSE